MAKPDSNAGRILRERIQRWSDEQIDEAARKRWAAMTDDERMAEYMRLVAGPHDLTRPG